MQAAGYGPLTAGWLENCSTALSRQLLSSPTAPILTALGGKMDYEIAVGINGRFWIQASEMAGTILVANAILASEFLTDAQCHILVQRLTTDAAKRSS